MTTSLTSLLNQRSALDAKINARLVAEIASMKSMGPAKKAAKRGRPAKAKTAKAVKATKVSKKAVKAAVAHKRAKNDMPLHAHLTAVLTGTQLTVTAARDAVLKNGFKTSNVDGLYSQVAVALSDETRFSKVQRGIYTAVASKVAAPAVETVVTPVVETVAPVEVAPVATTETPVANVNPVV